MHTFYARLALCAGLLLPNVFSAAAQTPTTFERHFGEKSTYDMMTKVQPTADGGYIAIGTTSNRSHGRSDIWLVKTNAAGDTLFTRTYGSASAEQGAAVQPTLDGGYVLAGTTYGFGAVGSNFYVLKVSGTGAVVWQRSIGSPGANACNDVALTQDGGYVVAGHVAGGAQVVKLDAAGTTVWSRTYSATFGLPDGVANAIQPTTDGGYVVAGYTIGSQEDFLLKINSLGAFRWRRKYIPASASGSAASVQQTSDGGYLVAGQQLDISNENAYLVKTDSAGNESFRHMVSGPEIVAYTARQVAGGDFLLLTGTSTGSELTKINSLGQATATVPAGSAANGWASALQITPDGGFVLTGSKLGAQNEQDGILLKYTAASTPQWNRVYGTPGPNGNDQGRDIQPTADGGSIVLSTRNATDMRLSKLDALGNVQWQQTTAGPTEPWSVRTTPDGGYITLHYNSTDLQAPVHFTKIDAQGVTQWVKTLPTGGFNTFGCIKPTTDGGYIAVTSHVVTGRSKDAWLLKLNAAGDTVWTRNFGTATADEGYDVVQTSSGDYVLAGRTLKPNTGNVQAWAVRVSATGQQIWNRAYGRSGQDRATSLQQTTDGGFILGGYSYVGATSSYCQGLLLKLTATGDSTWTRVTGLTTGFSFIYRVRQTPDGGYYAVETLETDISTPVRFESRRGRLLKTDGTGAVQWQREFGLGGYPILYGGELTADGGYLAVGGNVRDDQDVYVIKTDGSGNVLSNQLAAPPQLEWQLYPNPAFEQVRVQLPKEVRSGPVRLVLHDHLGRVVRQWHLLAPPADVPLDTRGLARGGYLLRVNGSSAVNQLKLSRRVILE